MATTYKVDGANGHTVRVIGGKEVDIATFNAKLKAVVNYITETKPIKKFITEFFAPDSIGEFEIGDDEFDDLDYSRINELLLLSPTVSTAAKEMAYCIRMQAREAEKRTAYLVRKLGWHKAGETNYYCAGDTLIGAESLKNVVIEDTLRRYKFEFDNSLLELDALRYVLRLIDIDAPITSIIFVTGLLGVMHQLFSDENIRVPCILYIMGSTQTRKTTVTRYATRLYNRRQMDSDTDVCGLRVSSSAFKAEELIDALKDATFILDDLNKTSDRQEKKIQEGRVRAVIRNFADNAPRTTARSAFENNCQVIVTSEYLLGGITNIGRMMVVKVNEPIDSLRLAGCQKNPLALSAFYNYFIKWLCENYDSVRARLRSEFDAFREGARNHKSGYERLYEQSFLLRFAFDVFLEYSKGVTSNINAETYRKSFSGYVNEALDKQVRVMSDVAKSEVDVTNFSRELLMLMKDGTIKPGKKGSECFEKGKHLYIINDYFCRMLRQKYKRDFTSREIAAYFRKFNISEVYDDNRAKKYHGKRYLILSLDGLKKNAAAAAGGL